MIMINQGSTFDVKTKKDEVVKVLIKHPAINVNVKDKDGLTEII